MPKALMLTGIANLCSTTALLMELNFLPLLKLLIILVCRILYILILIETLA